MNQCKPCNISKQGSINISDSIINCIGPCIKSTCLNDVWLVLSRADDSRFDGEVLTYIGLEYFLPQQQLSALGIQPGDKVKLDFSSELRTAIIQKIDIG